MLTGPFSPGSRTAHLRTRALAPSTCTGRQRKQSFSKLVKTYWGKEDSPSVRMLLYKVRKSVLPFFLLSRNLRSQLLGFQLLKILQRFQTARPADSLMNRCIRSQAKIFLLTGNHNSNTFLVTVPEKRQCCRCRLCRSPEVSNHVISLLNAKSESAK